MQALLSGSPIAVYSICFIAASVLYLGLAMLIQRRSFRPDVVLVLVGAGIAIRAALIPVQPVGSDDIYRYLWDGRVQAAGVNPYAYAPADSALLSLHTTELPARVNHPTYRTPYLPLGQWIFWCAWELGGGSTVGLKLLLFIAECLTLVLLERILRALALPRQNILLYALCPLPVFQFALDGHMDAFGLPLLLLSLLLWLRGRRPFALIVLGLSLAIKPVGLVLLPGALFSVKTWRERAMVVLLPLLVVVIQLLPYVGTADPVEGILVFGQNWSFNGSVFEIMFALLGNNQVARGVCGILLAAALVFIGWKKLPLAANAYLSVLLLLLLSPVVHPWYVAWLGILVPLVFARSGVAFLALASLPSLTVLAFVTTGIWEMSPWIMIIEYVPVFALLLLELRPILRRQYIT